MACSSWVVNFVSSLLCILKPLKKPLKPKLPIKKLDFFQPDSYHGLAYFGL